MIRRENLKSNVPKALLLILVFVFFSCGAGKQNALEQSQIYYRMAIDLDMKGESTQALAQTLKAEKLNPKDPEVQNFLGLLFTRNQMFDRAEMHLKKAISLEPEYSEARNNLCAMYIELNRFDEAIEQGLKAVENITYSSPERAYNNIGWAYYKKGDLTNSATYFNKALLHNKEFFQPHMNLAKIYFETGKYDDAKKSYESAIRSCKECSVLYYNLGMTLLKLKDKSGAIKRFEECKSFSKGDDFGEKCDKKLAVLK